MCNNNLAMPVIYCQNCGAKHSFSGKRPKSCSKCNNPFEVLARSVSVPAQPSKSTSKPSPKVPDPRLERRLALLAERRGVKTLTSKVVEDAYEEGDDLEFFDIPRPRSLASVEVRNGSVGSIGSVLKSENPEAFKDL